MTKQKLPSAAQAKRIAKCWADDRPINIMVRGRHGDGPWNDATTIALQKSGWIAEAGMQFEENGYCWVSYKVTPEGLTALECYLGRLRYEAASLGTLKAS